MSASTQRWRGWMHALLAVAGITGVVLLVRAVGLAQLCDTVRGLAGWFALLLALEGLRIGSDAWTLRMLYGGRVPWRAVLSASLVSYPATLLLPAGRAAGEALKVGLLHRWVGVDRAVAAALFAQAYALFGGFVLSLPCVWAAFAVWGGSGLAWAIALQAVTAIGLGAVIVVAARRRETSGVIGALSQRFGTAVEGVTREAQAMGLPKAPLATMVLNRFLGGLQVALLAYALGIADALAEPLLVVGTYLVGAAAGDLVPAQIGATDGVLAYAATSLGAGIAATVALTLMVHAVQLAWAAAGAVAALLLRPPR